MKPSLEDVVKAKMLVVTSIAVGALALATAAPGDEWGDSDTKSNAGAALERGPQPREPASAKRAADAGAASVERKRADTIKLKLKRSPYGKVLFADGFALYLFTADGGSGSVCNGECAKAWPPLEAGDLAAGRGVRAKLLGETTRDDGSQQLTYAGKPLYFYVHDPRGEVYCNDVFEFGGDWFAVKKTGKPA